jgi:hypothetical protein
MVTFIRDSDPSKDELPNTIIDRWADWVSSVTDAPNQYHRATGVVILSTILTPYISLPTRFGSIIPNVWCMILAGTTTTRKSTSMDLAMLMLRDVTGPEYKMATDGSPEGLLSELSYRDGRVSVFHRDEITGFMNKVSGQDYMAGLLESFTRLYDCKPEKRVLRKEVIEIEEPYLIFVAGGIKSRMEEIVGMDHIRSGFLPRFIFVTGQTSSDQMWPIGPPSEEEMLKDGSSPRDQILAELWSIHHYYSETGQTEKKVTIRGITALSSPKPRRIQMTASAEAWKRIQQLKTDAIKLGEDSSAPELYTPIYDRLSNTVIKVAMLLAGAEMVSEITYNHVCKAILLSQEWLETVTGFATNIEQKPDIDKWERKTEKIVQWIKSRYPHEVTQTEVMQRFRIRKRDIDDIEATLIARGQITITPYPHPKNIVGSKVRYRVYVAAPRYEAQNKIDREDTFLATPNRFPKNGRGRNTPDLQPDDEEATWYKK